jgi:DNA-directed RNA polymerase specialized sigma24 family protein
VSTRPPDDAAAIAASRHRPQAFDEIFRRHFADVYRFAARQLGSVDGEEVAAETFARAFAARDRFSADWSARAWLFGICINVVRDRQRSSARRRRAYARAYEPDVHDDGSADASLDARGRRAELLAALGRLRLAERWVDRFLIFDPATSRLIGYRELSPGTPATQRGGDRAWAEYLAQGSITLHVPPVPKRGSSRAPSARTRCVRAPAWRGRSQRGGACGWLAVIARPPASANAGCSPVPLVRMWWSWSSLWWRGQSRMRLSSSVLPPCSNAMTWWASSSRAAVQPGYWHCPSARLYSARCCA